MQLNVAPPKTKRDLLELDAEERELLGGTNPAVTCPRPTGTGNYWWVCMITLGAREYNSTMTATTRTRNARPTHTYTGCTRPTRRP